MQAGLSRNVDFELHGAVVFLLVGRVDGQRAALLLGLNGNLFQALFILRPFRRGIAHFSLVPTANRDRPVESADIHARGAADRKTLGFLAGNFRPAVGANSDTVNGSRLRTGLPLDLFLRLLALTLRFAHRGVHLSLCFALCLACRAFIARYVDLHANDVVVNAFYRTAHLVGNRFAADLVDRSDGHTRTECSSVLRVRDTNRTIHVRELELRTAGTNLAVEAMTDVLAILHLNAEVVADRSVHGAGPNRSTRVRRNDDRDAAVDGADRDRLRFIELCEHCLQRTVDG